MRLDAARDATVPLALHPQGQPCDRAKHGEARRERRHGPPEADHRGWRPRRQRAPPGRVRGADQRAGDKRRQHHEHARAAAAGRVERPGRAAAAELHADAEDEGADQHREAGRRDRATHWCAEERPGGEQREEDGAGDGEHQHLGAKSGAAAIADEDPPGRGESERGVIQHQARGTPDEEQRRLPAAHHHLQRDSRERDDSSGHERPAGCRHARRQSNLERRRQAHDQSITESSRRECRGHYAVARRRRGELSSYGPENYSLRNALTGSTRDALIAGMRLAASATSISTAAAAP